ncbi:patatin-like phospholipase family protein [Fluviibacterium sp. DFM31]|uniref:Patatin-like phospholipase family protein n=1 Tax=Meridianimarinicoccus marinus TaxID=3231483 RepID=A0ABV3L6T9_9RHOB
MRLAIALSGGGAAGIGHVPVLEVVDELGLRPIAISGTSMGALIGAGYAAGMTGRDIRAWILSIAENPAREMKRFLASRPGRFPFVPGALNAHHAVQIALPPTMPERFESLGIPFTAVATDFHARETVFLRKGPLKPALAASIAIPGVFRPSLLEGRVLMDGGVTNNLPLDALPEADLVLAVDVASVAARESTEVPGPMEAAVGAMRIMMHRMLKQQLEDRPGALLIEPKASAFPPLAFRKAAEILEVASADKDAMKRALERAMS